MQTEYENLLQKGETSFVQFKADVRNATSIAREMVAFANSKGGKIIVGVDDKTGQPTGLSYQDIHRINNLLTTAAQEQVKSPINIETDTVKIGGKNLIVVEIQEGTNKPYMDKDGLVYVKNGADKRKVTSNNELRRLLQSSGNLYAEENILQHTDVRRDLDRDRFTDFYVSRYNSKPDFDNLSQLLINLRLAQNNHLTLSGALLFGLNNRYLLPSFYIAAVWYRGTELAGTEYYKSDNIFGTLKTQYDRAFEFIDAKLERPQQGQDFNSTGIPEIPGVVLRELIINALVHRDYFIEDNIKLLVFDNRIEIRSPGTLPNNLDEASIRLGVSKRRNPIISNFALDILPYRAVGSGIVRALRAYPAIDFENDLERNEFKVTIWRNQ